LRQRDRTLARPENYICGLHVAEHPHHPNVSVRHRRTLRLTWTRTLHTGCGFFFKYSDRVLFGTDLVLELELYGLHFRFRETADHYFEYPSHASRQGKVEYL
jgi:hypothetical protein